MEHARDLNQTGKHKTEMGKTETTPILDFEGQRLRIPRCTAQAMAATPAACASMRAPGPGWKGFQRTAQCACQFTITSLPFTPRDPMRA